MKHLSHIKPIILRYKLTLLTCVFICLNFIIIAQGVTITPSTGSLGYDDGQGGNGYGLDYELSTPKPHTYLLQHVTAHIIYRCGDDIVLERMIDYYEWFLTGNDGKVKDQHFWAASFPSAILAVVNQYSCPRTTCDPMTAEVTQNFELGEADVNIVAPLVPLHGYPNGAQFGYLSGGTDSLIVRNCTKDTTIANPAQEPFVRGTAPEHGGRFGFSFKDPEKLQGVTHSSTTTFTGSGRIATPGEGHDNSENYEAIEDKKDFTEEEEETKDEDLPDDESSLPSDDSALVNVDSVIATGRPSPDIATAYITNPNDFPVALQPQRFYIPSSDGIQAMGGKIPGDIVIGPNETTVITIPGVCFDHSLPAPAIGSSMDPNTWIGIEEGPPSVSPTDPADTADQIIYVPIVEHLLPRYTHADTQKIKESSTFEPNMTPDTSQITLTWPGSDIPVGGHLNPRSDPTTSIPIIMEYWERIEEATDIVQRDTTITTPYSGEKETVSIIQPGIWEIMGALTNKRLKEDHVKDQVYTEFEDKAGRSVESLTEQEKEVLDGGIEQFNIAIDKVLEIAKVTLPSYSHRSSDKPLMVYDIEEEPVLISADDKCQCDSITLTVTLRKQGTDESETVNLTSLSLEDSSPTEYTSAIEVEAGDIIDVSISGLRLYCSCPENMADASLCNDIYRTENTRVGQRKIRNEVGVSFGSDRGSNDNQNIDFTTITEREEYSLRIVDENRGSSTYQRIKISAHCTDDDDCGERSTRQNDNNCHEDFKIRFNDL